MQTSNKKIVQNELSTKPPSVEMIYLDQLGDEVELKYENSFKIHSIHLSDDIQICPEPVEQTLQTLSKSKKFILQYKLLVLDTLFRKSPYDQPILYYVILLDQYYHLPLYIGDQVKLFGWFTNQTLIIQRPQDDKKQNPYLLFDPTILITPTQINQVSFCERSEVIRGIIRRYEEPEDENTQIEVSLPMLVGNISHNIFEKFIQHQNLLEFKDIQTYKDIINGAKGVQLPNYLTQELYIQYINNISSFYILNLTFQQFCDDISLLVSKCLLWILEYVVIQKNLPIQYMAAQKKESWLIIQKLVSVEQSMESYDYGLHGKLDILLLATLCVKGEKNKEVLVPLELKTGVKQNNSYRLQAQIYAQLTKKYYPDKEVLFSLLLYVQQDQCQVVINNDFDWSQIIFQRNFIAQSIKQARKDPLLQKLPPIINNINSCNQCEVSEICSAIQLLNNPEIEDVNVGFTEFYNVKRRLGKESLSYLKEQMQALYEEEQAQVLNLNKENLNYFSRNINEIFKCFESRMLAVKTKICDQIQFDLQSESKSYLSVFKAMNNFREQDQVILICDHIGLKIYCTIISLDIRTCYDQNKENIIILDGDNSQSQLEIHSLVIKVQVSQFSSANDLSTYEQLKMKRNNFQQLEWFIRKRDYNPYQGLRGSVFALLTKDRYERLRNIIVKNVKPTFNTQNSAAINMVALSTNLNRDQQSSIIKSLEADDFAIIEGYPGTGKTFTIANLLNILQWCNQKILVVTYTHQALDNILLVFAQCFRDSLHKITRLSSQISKVHQEALQYVFDPKDFNDIHLIREYLKSKQIFFTTCLSIHDTYLKTIQFDYCIVDEASQIIEPLCLGCIMMAKKFILIGDHRQLQPLVKNKKYRDILSRSLLERLSSQYPEATTKLTLQYRMNNQIMQLSNQMVYDGQLKVGDPILYDRQLKLHHPNHYGNLKLKKLFDGTTGVCFLNYKIDEQRHKHLQPTEVINKEANIIVSVCKLFLDAGVSNRDISIITTYNKSARIIKEKIDPIQKFMSVLTIDKSQGLDKECVFVVCSSMDQSNQLMNDWRRINVAFTRARSKLIILGNSGYISGLPNMNGFYQSLKQYEIEVDDEMENLLFKCLY